MLGRLAGGRLDPLLEMQRGGPGGRVVIEACPEDLALKRNLFGALAEICGPDAVLATNTSSLSVTDIARGLPHPERICGMHFFNPPALMKLVEVVATADTAEEALATVEGVARAMGREPVRCTAPVPDDLRELIRVLHDDTVAAAERER